MTFPKRPTKRQGDWLVKEWRSKCGAYRITLADIHGLTPIYRATIYQYENGRAYWGRLSNHRKLSAAQAACEQHAKRSK